MGRIRQAQNCSLAVRTTCVEEGDTVPKQKWEREWGVRIDHRFVPSILGATVPRDSLLNFNEVIPGGRYSSNSGSTESFITNSAAWIIICNHHKAIVSKTKTKSCADVFLLIL